MGRCEGGGSGSDRVERARIDWLGMAKGWVPSAISPSCLVQRIQAAQNGSSDGTSLSFLLFFSRALMRDFAAMLLCWKRYDSLPVSTIWQ